MESTHHGPTDVSLPMVYAEIGSAEEQWKDHVAGEIAACAILNVKKYCTNSCWIWGWPLCKTAIKLC